MNESRQVVRTHIPALDGVRGLAASSVIVAHLHLPDVLAQKYPALVNLKELGWIGVPLFFVLSGYLITWLGLKEYAERGNFNLRRFYIRRALRIWPLYFSASILGLTIWHSDRLRLLGAEPAWSIPLLTFTVNFFATSWGRASLGALLPLWTVAIEEQFYLIWGAMMRYCSKRRLIYYGTVAICVSLLCRSIVKVDGGVFLSYRMNSFVALGSIMTGCMIALAEPSIRQQCDRVGLRNIARITGIALAGVCIFGWPFPNTTVTSAILCCSVDVTSAGVLVYALHSRSSFLEFSIFRYLGRISYALYAIHFWVFRYYYKIAGQDLAHLLPSPESPFLLFVVEAAILISVTVVLSECWTRLETPLSRMRKHFA